MTETGFVIYNITQYKPKNEYFTHQNSKHVTIIL